MQSEGAEDEAQQLMEEFQCLSVRNCVTDVQNVWLNLEAVFLWQSSSDTNNLSESKHLT